MIVCRFSKPGTEKWSNDVAMMWCGTIPENWRVLFSIMTLPASSPHYSLVKGYVKIGLFATSPHLHSLWQFQGTV